MKVVLALGSNLGNRESNLNGAIENLEKFIAIKKISNFVETEPIGGPEQGRFLNAVLIGECELEPDELLERTQDIENAFGRERVVHWGPRTLDIDLISIGDLEVNTEKLTLPHPHAHLRKFVLAPWLEIEPGAELIGKGPISKLLAALN